MERKNSSLSIKIIYWFTNLVLISLALYFVVFIIYNVLLYAIDSENEVGFSLPLTAKIDLVEIGNLKINDQNVNVRLRDASSSIYFVNPPRYIARIIGIITLLILFFATYLSLSFRKFIVNVKMGEIFTVNNIKLLKRISYGLVGIWIVKTVGMKITYLFIVNRIEFKSISFSKTISADIFFNYTGILLIAIFIWVLAHIFMTGLKLQEEKDLTI